MTGTQNLENRSFAWRVSRVFGLKLHPNQDLCDLLDLEPAMSEYFLRRLAWATDAGWLILIIREAVGSRMSHGVCDVPRRRAHISIHARRARRADPGLALSPSARP
ncbi:MAG: hypothetical protein JW940_11290 [Polyangiaceae bacterium]|nr:hypothetical protein [Polyangiaceae bacterium]